MDPNGHLLGIINLDEAHLASQTPDLERFLVAADLMRTDVAPLTPEDALDFAQEQFVEYDGLALPVMNNRNDRTVVGLVAKRFDIARAYVRHVHGKREA